MRAVAVVLALVLALGAACSGAKSIPEAAPATSQASAPVELNTPTLPPTTEAPTTTTEAPARNSGIVEGSTVPVATTRQPAPTTDYSAYPYNGWAIPEYIVSCETGGTFSWTAYNKSSGASGPYQIMPEWFGGELAMNQSHAAQHAMAARIWDGGRGASNWAQCL